MTLADLTIGSYRAKSYATLPEADEYLTFDPQRAPGWLSLADDAKSRYLVGATRRLDEFAWRGEQVAADQGTAWPRTGFEAPLPADIVHATILLAADYDDVSLSASGGSGGIKRKRVGPLEIEYARGAAASASHALVGDQLAHDILVLISRYLVAPVLTFSSGTGSGSWFDDFYGRVGTAE